MTAQTSYSVDDVAHIVGIALRQFAAQSGVTAARPTPGPVEHVYTLDEVAAITRIPERYIADGCRSGELPYVKLSRPGTSKEARGMTAAQISDLVRRRITIGASSPEPADDMDAARKASQRAAGRRSSRRAA